MLVMTMGVGLELVLVLELELALELVLEFGSFDKQEERDLVGISLFEDLKGWKKDRDLRIPAASNQALASDLAV